MTERDPDLLFGEALAELVYRVAPALAAENDIARIREILGREVEQVLYRYERDALDTSLDEGVRMALSELDRLSEDGRP